MRNYHITSNLHVQEINEVISAVFTTEDPCPSGNCTDTSEYKTIRANSLLTSMPFTAIMLISRSRGTYLIKPVSFTSWKPDEMKLTIQFRDEFCLMSNMKLIISYFNEIFGSALEINSLCKCMKLNWKYMFEVW